MIRFGKFEDSWTSKTNSDKHRRIFPIPQTVIDATSETPNTSFRIPGIDSYMIDNIKNLLIFKSWQK